MNKIKSLIGAICLIAATSQAQIPSLGVGSTFQYQGQTFTIGTNSAGQIITTENGNAGTAQALTPESLNAAAQTIGAEIQANNPSNADYYGTNEYEARVGGAYSQNSGQAAALISVTKWGLLKVEPNIGAEVALLQGNEGGTSGTAAAYAAVDYRRIIGDVAAEGGIGGGYDNYNKRPMGLAKAGVEYRTNAHVGVFTDIFYAIEPKGSYSRGMGFAGGVVYAF